MQLHLFLPVLEGYFEQVFHLDKLAFHLKNLYIKQIQYDYLYFVEFVFFYYEFVKGTDVLNYITIYKSNPMLFVNTITLLSKGLPVKTPSSWGYLLKNETHTIGGALVVDTITFKDVEFLVKYFS